MNILIRDLKPNAKLVIEMQGDLVTVRTVDGDSSAAFSTVSPVHNREVHNKVIPDANSKLPFGSVEVTERAFYTIEALRPQNTTTYTPFSNYQLSSATSLYSYYSSCYPAPVFAKQSIPDNKLYTDTLDTNQKAKDISGYTKKVSGLEGSVVALPEPTPGLYFYKDIDLNSLYSDVKREFASDKKPSKPALKPITLGDEVDLPQTTAKERPCETCNTPIFDAESLIAGLCACCRNK